MRFWGYDGANENASFYRDEKGNLVMGVDPKIYKSLQKAAKLWTKRQKQMEKDNK